MTSKGQTRVSARPNISLVIKLRLLGLSFSMSILQFYIAALQRDKVLGSHPTIEMHDH